MPINDWLDMMPATVTYEAVSTRNDYGKPTAYAAAVSYRARIRYKTRRVVSRVSGEDVVASGSIIVNGVISGIKPEDRITLPNGTTPKIASWDTVMDEDANHHTKIYFI